MKCTWCGPMCDWSRCDCGCHDAAEHAAELAEELSWAE
jgi:hypothetical protein